MNKVWKLCSKKTSCFLWKCTQQQPHVGDRRSNKTIHPVFITKGAIKYQDIVGYMKYSIYCLFPRYYWLVNPHQILQHCIPHFIVILQDQTASSTYHCK